MTQNVRLASRVALSTSSATVLTGVAVTFTATVSGTGGSPTGTVTFKNGTTVLGTATISGGVATFVTSTLPAGTDQITAVYNGDTNFDPATSNTVAETVNIKKGRIT